MLGARVGDITKTSYRCYDQPCMFLAKIRSSCKREQRCVLWVVCWLTEAVDKGRGAVPPSPLKNRRAPRTQAFQTSLEVVTKVSVCVCVCVCVSVSEA